MHVFTYGSLMYRAVWERVIPGAHPARGGAIHGYVRRRITNEVYPALVGAGPESTVRGVVYADVSESELATVDRFEDEGELYRRIPVSVALDDGTVLEAWAYVFLHPERVDDSPWDVEQFEAQGLETFLNTYCRDRAP